VDLTRVKTGWSYGCGTGSSTGASTRVNTSTGRAWIVPWIRIPARTEHHCSARACASTRSLKCSPAQKLPRTNCTARSTLGLSLGERTLAGSVTNPACWA